MTLFDEEASAALIAAVDIMKKDIISIIKWAGGKKQSLDTLQTQYPENLKTGEITRYIEPFLGGGTILFDILRNYPTVKEVYVNDINEELIKMYEVVRDDVELLITELEKMEHAFNTLLSNEEKETMFYDIRIEYNQEIDNPLQGRAKIQQAARFIFLNKTCFNGLYRVNKKGQYNVPFGKKVTISLFDQDKLQQASRLLQKVQLYHCSFENMLSFVTEDSFIFLDPPYRPRKSSSTMFTQYQASDFNDSHQQLVHSFFEKADALGAKLMLTNSVSDDNFLPQLFKNYRIQTYQKYYGISGKSDGRKKEEDYIICNY